MAKNNGSAVVKWLIIIVVLAALGAGAWYFFGRSGDRAPQYQTATISRGDIIQNVTATGTLNPVVNVQVGSQISGIIQKLNADYNTKVTSNQVVAQLDPSTYLANVQSAEGDLANARANLELNQVQTKRAEELFKSQLISSSDYDTAVATLHQAEAQVQIKGAAVTNAQINLQRCTIYAPVDGVVISRAVDVGQTVAASLSAPVLFTIANDLAKMQIDANVSEADVGTVEEGQTVNFTVDAFPSRTFPGQVVQIRNSPTTVQNVVTYDVVIGVSNKDLKLRPGMTANASVVTAQRNGVLKIPNAALRFKPPEVATNKVATASGSTTNATNSVTSAKTSTNKTETAEAPLTGNEPPEELMRRVRDMRERGEEVPPEIRAKLRELFQSGALQRPGGGGGGGGGGNRNAQPSSRTIYVVAPKSPGSEETTLTPVRIKTGISDGAFTEVVDGLKEGDVVATGVKYSPTASTASAPAANPFGGAGGGGGGGGGRRF